MSFQETIKNLKSEIISLTESYFSSELHYLRLHRTHSIICLPIYSIILLYLFNIHFMTSLHTNITAPRPVFNPLLCLLIIALIKSNQLRLALDKV